MSQASQWWHRVAGILRRMGSYMQQERHTTIHKQVLCLHRAAQGAQCKTAIGAVESDNLGKGLWTGALLTIDRMDVTFVCQPAAKADARRAV